MKKLITTIAKLLIVVAITISCEEVIELDLNEMDPTLVIEGKISDISDSAVVKISKTGNFFDEYTPVSDVNVTSVLIIDDTNDTLTLAEQKKGYFSAPFNFKQYDKTYRLEVIEDNIEYTAASTIKKPVAIEGIFITDSLPYDTTWIEDYNTEDSLMLSVYVKDPLETDNYYRLKLYVNDTLRALSAFDFHITNDYGYEGKSFPMMISETFRREDKVYIELVQYDADVYDFFYTMFNSMGQAMSGTPYNPTTNFEQDDVFGYFAAYSADTLSVPIMQASRIMENYKLNYVLLQADQARELYKIDTAIIDAFDISMLK